MLLDEVLVDQVNKVVFLGIVALVKSLSLAESGELLAHEFLKIYFNAASHALCFHSLTNIKFR